MAATDMRVLSVPGSGLTGNILTLSGVIQQVDSYNRPLLGLILQSDPDNNGLVYVYDSSGSRRVAFIQAGGSYAVDVGLINRLYVEGTNGDILYWSGVEV